MRHQLTLRLLGSIACCAILGCQPNQRSSSTADNSDRPVTQSPDSDEAGTAAPAGDIGSAQAAHAERQGERPSAPAAISTVSNQQRSKKPSQQTRTGRRSPAADVPPSIETELPSGSTSVTAAGAEAPTEVRETFFPNGSTRSQWIVKVLPDGTEVEHGESLMWYDDGQVKMQGEYVDGVRDGLWRSWYPDGRMRGEGRLHRNKRIGTWTMWHDNGQKRIETAYDKGLAHGRSTAWDADGNVIETGEYVRKKKHGIWITYVDGEKTETEWVNGVQVE